jgi:transcriptional regulator with XRE-family HTH domain
VKVRARRHELAFGVEQAAGRMELEARQLRRIEKGEANITFDSLLRLSAGLDLRASELLRAIEGVLLGSERDKRTSTVPVPEAAIAAAPGAGERRHAIHSSVGEEVARRRALLRQTQRGLARLAGVSLSAVQSVERGRHAPTTQTLEALADALQCHVSELLPRERTTRG